MRIVHLATEYSPPEPRKPKKPSKADERIQRARQWAVKMRQRDYQKALLEHADVIAEIRKRDPSYKPRMS